MNHFPFSFLLIAENKKRTIAIGVYRGGKLSNYWL